MIKGITVTLFEKTLVGQDAFNKDIYEEEPVEVDNVLVAPSSSDEVIDMMNLYGKKAVYTLAIPKGDEHEWRDRKVEFFGTVFHSFGIPLEGIECDIPLDWNKKVMVEAYE